MGTGANAIETHQPDLIRHRNASLAQAMQHTKRQLVTHREDGVKRLSIGNQAGYRAAPLFLA